MNSDEYREKFRDVMTKLEETGKFDVMRGTCIGLILSGTVDAQLRQELLLSLTYLTVRLSLNENSAFAEITKSLQVTQEEGQFVQTYLKELLKKEPENGTANTSS